MSLDVRFQFRKLAKLMSVEAEVSGGTGHAVTTGRLREFILHNFLRPHLPQTIGIRSVIIIDSQGNRSKQQDWILVDNNHPIISVGSDEIKSFLSTAELSSTLEAIAATKNLHRNGEQMYCKGGIEVRIPKPHPILAYIFAFDGSNLDTLHAEVAKFAFGKNDGGAVPEAICVLKKGTIQHASLMPTINLTKSLAVLPQIKGMDLTYQPLQKDALFAFYGRLKDDVIPPSHDQFRY
jgi:hypothetical protein